MASRGNYYNWLQPAIAHLGVTRTGFGPTRAVPTFGDARYSFWPDFYQVAKQIDSLNGSTEFDYGSYSWTGKNSLGVGTRYTPNVPPPLSSPTFPPRPPPSRPRHDCPPPAATRFSPGTTLMATKSTRPVLLSVPATLWTTSSSPLMT